MPAQSQDEIQLSASTAAAAKTAGPPDKLAWPDGLATQVAAVQKLVPALGPDPEAIAARFGRNFAKCAAHVAGILETLLGLGKLWGCDDFEIRWMEDLPFAKAKPSQQVMKDIVPECFPGRLVAGPVHPDSTKGSQLVDALRRVVMAWHGPDYPMRVIANLRGRGTPLAFACFARGVTPAPAAASR